MDDWPSVGNDTRGTQIKWPCSQLLIRHKIVALSLSLVCHSICCLFQFTPIYQEWWIATWHNTTCKSIVNEPLVRSKELFGLSWDTLLSTRNKFWAKMSHIYTQQMIHFQWQTSNMLWMSPLISFKYLIVRAMLSGGLSCIVPKIWFDFKHISKHFFNPFSNQKNSSRSSWDTNCCALLINKTLCILPMILARSIAIRLCAC